MKTTLIAALSLDGFIARSDRPGTDFCSPEDQARFRENLRCFDSLITGRTTYELSRDAIAASNADRLRFIWTRDPGNWAAETRPDRVEFTAASPSEMLAALAERGRQRCAILGGGELYGAFLAADLVDELWLTYEPVLFGKGVSLANTSLDARFALESSERLGAGATLLKFRRNK